MYMYRSLCTATRTSSNCGDEMLARFNNYRSYVMYVDTSLCMCTSTLINMLLFVCSSDLIDAVLLTLFYRALCSEEDQQRVDRKLASYRRDHPLMSQAAGTGRTDAMPPPALLRLLNSGQHFKQPGAHFIASPGLARDIPESSGWDDEDDEDNDEANPETSEGRRQADLHLLSCIATEVEMLRKEVEESDDDAWEGDEDDADA